MKVTVEHKPLTTALTWVAKAIASRPPNEILKGVKLTASESGHLTLFGTDFEAWLSMQVEAEVEEPGEVVVPAHFLRDMVAALSGKQVELAVDGSALSIKAGRSQYRAPIFPAQDYPNEADFPKQVGVVEAESLRQMVKTVRFPIDDRSPHEFIRGVRIEGREDELRMVGLAQAVLSTMTQPWDRQADFECHAISSLVELAVAGMQGRVVVAYDDKLIGFKDATRQAVIRCLGGEFAAWRKALPERHDFTARLDTAELEAAIKRAALATSAAGSAERPIWFTVAKDRLEVTAGSVGEADGVEVIDAVADGELTTGLFAGFLAGVLAHVPSEMVTLSFQNDPKKAVVISPDDHPSLHAVVPRLPRK